MLWKSQGSPCGESVPMKSIFQFVSLLLMPLLVMQPLSAQTPAATPAVDLQIHLVAKEGGAKGFTVQVTDLAGAGVSDAAVVLRLPDEGFSGKFADGSRAAIAYTDAAGRAEIGNVQWDAGAGRITMKLTATKGTAHAGMLVEQTVTTVQTTPPAAQAPAIASSPAPVSSPAPAPVPTPVPAASTVPAPGQPMVSVRQPAAVARPSTQAALEPTVSVTNGPGNHEVHSGGGSHKKWIILAVVVAAGAGAGMAMAGKGKSNSSSSSSSSSLSIGTPSVSVGHP
jgi:hypothetical protein